MHENWGKMLFYVELAKIQQSKRSKSDKNKKVLKVDIKEPIILSKLKETHKCLEGFPELLGKLFSDMDKFDFLNTSSVTDRDEKWDSNTYGSIKLFNHLTRALDIAIIKMEEMSIPISQRAFFGLLVLLHDFGKSHSLCAEYDISLSLEHDKRSAYYFQKLAQDNYYKIDSHAAKAIFDILFAHHTASLTEIENNFALKFLIDVDNQERMEEGEFLKLEEKEAKKSRRAL